MTAATELSPPAPPMADDGEADRPATSHRNSVSLVGRVSGTPEERTLPSGDRVVAFRLVVERGEQRGSAGRSRQRVDTVDCAAWGARVRRSTAALQPGDTVEVEGALRRRFRRTAAGPTSRVEVEVRTARRRR